jgi:hypothetical protein
MSFIGFIKRHAANYVAVKIALSIMGLAVSIPLMNLLYWSFDSAYLAAFGVGPEIYSRPVFSSKLMLTWFVLGAITPSIWIMGIVALTLAVILFGIHYKARRLSISLEQTIPVRIGTEDNSPVRISEILDRSITPAVYLFLVPFLILLFLLVGMVFMSNKGRELAENQIKSYVDKGECLDTFNNNTRGCYSISDESEDNYLIISNSEKIVIYLNRQMSKKGFVVFVNIKDKSSNKKITRLLRQDAMENCQPKSGEQ